MLPALEMDVAGGEGRQAEDSRLGRGVGRVRTEHPNNQIVPLRLEVLKRAHGGADTLDDSVVRCANAIVVHGEIRR